MLRREARLLTGDAARADDLAGCSRAGVGEHRLKRTVTPLLRRGEYVTDALLNAAESQMGPNQAFDFLEAGVGIEPAYTALQAAALTNKSIRCARLTPRSTPHVVNYPRDCLNTSCGDPARWRTRYLDRGDATF